jgi:hypothetical protein
MNTWSCFTTHHLYEPTLYFVMPGVYVPQAGLFGTEWFYDWTDDAVWGIWVESAANAEKFATVIVVPARSER